ncbi:unnamed protein product [Caenorhabditis bovis]|uniref:C2H2-type domain-containing protein n=1 Tax=Caenorhabditis bovis TaxID=2654633 RepID=A0A8S1EU49_9PELO|nr:unnamed protein product [Caenorhabditis bovis]
MDVAEKAVVFPAENSVVYDCENCERSFNTEHALNCHIKIHNEKTLKCTFCDAMFRRLDQLFSHVADHEMNLARDFECPVKHCDAKIPSFRDGTQHILMHSAQFPCKNCDETFSKFRRLFHHHALQHGTLKAFAEEEKFNHKINQKNLKNEKRKQKKRAACEMEEPTASPAPKAAEVEEDEEMSSLQFVDLLKSTVTKSNDETPSQVLERISKFITDVFPQSEEDRCYRCTHCEMSFGDAILWMTHLGFHDGVDPFKCTGCSKKFENRIEFVIHLTYFAHGSQNEDAEQT